MHRSIRLSFCGWLIVAPAVALAAAPGERVVSAGKLRDAKEFTVETGTVSIVPEGPKHESVARFDDEFAIRLDLAPRGVDLHQFDLIKLQVKADAHAFLVVSLENFPQPGQMAHWYVLDAARLEFPWRTIWIDLHKPEEVKLAGTYKGGSAKDPDARGLVIRGNVVDIRREIQGPGRSIWLSDVRLARKGLELDWDQAQAPYTWDKGKDLVYRFPLVARNKSDSSITARVRLAPIDGRNAKGTLSQEKVSLKPGEAKPIEAKLTLPAEIAAKAAPLYCERFEALADIEGQADSEVTILRSSDVIPLSVTVPLPDDLLQYPLLPRVSKIPEPVTQFGMRNRAIAMTAAEEVTVEDLATAMSDPYTPFDFTYGFNFNNSKNPRAVASERYRIGLTSCAFLYDFTGDKKYLEKGTQLLLKAAELFPRRLADWRKTPYSPISQGIFAANLLQTGWAFGSMRWPYSFERHGVFNDFDLLARDMEPAAREKIVRDLLVPAAIQMRNHYFGLTNQQDVVNYPVLYAGLVSRNWPLVSHAYDSPHGLVNQLQYNFDDAGLAGEGNYHKPAIEPILYACELLRGRGIDLYDQRLSTILHSPGAAAINKSYDSPMLGFADTERLAGKGLITPSVGGGMHLKTGTTILRWQKTDVGMNWGTALNRNAPDRCALRINELGGGNYTHSSLGQSIIIIDEGLQQTKPAQVLGYDVQGPMQYVTARSSDQFPGSTITRTFALFGDGVLVLDRVVNDKPRTVDWCLKGAGERFSFKVTEVAGGFTQKPDDRERSATFGANLNGNKHFVAEVEGPWNEGNGRMMMAGEPGTRVFSFRVAAAFSAGSAAKQGVPVLMVRRTETTQTDFVAFFSKVTKSVERLPVVAADEKETDALGARVTLRNGKVIHALVNYREGTEVRMGNLTTKELFATDFPDE